MNSRIVLCLDGTWNNPFKPVERDDKTTVLKPTNPLKLSRAILPVDPETNTRQLTYYDSGVGGLGLYPGLTNKMLEFVDSKLGGAWGAGFEANVEQAVTFLAMNYSPGDQIFVFGFSRGSAQARALTHFISWLGGIPQKKDAYYIPIFFRHYLSNKGGGDPSNVKSSKGDTPAERVQKASIKFLGVWDTVMALGSRFRATSKTTSEDRSFHTKLKPAPIVENAWQALAIDETRYDFRPEVWTDHHVDQVLNQCWFLGAHANVGGSYENDGLANIALDWMVQGAQAQGLAFDTAFLKPYRPFPQDVLSSAHTAMYDFIEAIRFRRGKGIRSLIGYPPAACLALHKSVIERLCSDPEKFEKSMKLPYRSENVIELLREHKEDMPSFILSVGLSPKKWRIPADVLQDL